MNIIEKQAELGKSLYEINTSTLKEYWNLQRTNFEKYVEVNREFGARIPEIKSVSGAVELQKEYNETLWGQAKASVEAHAELIKGAFGDTRDALKTAYSSSVTEEIVDEAKKVAKTATKAKTKAKAKVKSKKAVAE